MLITTVASIFEIELKEVIYSTSREDLISIAHGLIYKKSAIYDACRRYVHRWTGNWRQSIG